MISLTLHYRVDLCLNLFSVSIVLLMTKKVLKTNELYTKLMIVIVSMIVKSMYRITLTIRQMWATRQYTTHFTRFTFQHSFHSVNFLSKMTQMTICFWRIVSMLIMLIQHVSNNCKKTTLKICVTRNNKICVNVNSTNNVQAHNIFLWQVKWWAIIITQLMQRVVCNV